MLSYSASNKLRAATMYVQLRALYRREQTFQTKRLLKSEDG